MKKNSMQKKYLLRKEIIEQVKELSIEEGKSETAVIESAVASYYAAEVVDENILLARLSTIERKFGYISNKCDTFFNLILFMIPQFFSRMPALPKDKKEMQLVLDRGTETTNRLIMLYRKWQKTDNISFMQAVYGDSQESLKERYEENS